MNIYYQKWLDCYKVLNKFYDQGIHSEISVWVCR